MDMTVGRLKVGSKLIFGQYGVQDDQPSPILWLKATPNGDFITADALDYLCFDARELGSDSWDIRMCGRADYALSNIHAFLNSDQQSWWHPSHDCDAPPSGNNIGMFREAYENHAGFLYHFEDYEVDCLLSEIRLPFFRDIIGERKFRLFSRKGARVRGSEDYIRNHGFWHEFDTGSYIDFWLADTPGNVATVLTRSGIQGTRSPYLSSGLRPVCSLNPETILDIREDGSFYVRPSEVRKNIFSDEEFFELLGMARP